MMKNPWMEKRPNWSLQENKLFEDALAYFDKDTPDRWVKVAEMIPGKAAADVMTHYQDLVDDVKHIEAGMIPLPGYSSSFTLDWESTGGKKSGARTPDHERKKGVPWTEEEHKLFLMGLKKYGKGDWRNISRNFVVSRTPTQVASHAQKYFIRLGSGSKDKRRSSIHDITNANLPNNRPPSPPQSSSSDQFSVVIDPNQRSEVGDHYAMKLETIHSHISVCDSMTGRHGSLFRAQTENPWPHGY